MYNIVGFFKKDQGAEVSNLSKILEVAEHMPSALFYKTEASEKIDAQAKSDLLVFCFWSTQKLSISNFALDY